MGQLKQRTYELLVENPEGDRLAQGVSIGIIALIAVNVVVSIAETEPTLHEWNPDFFFYFELFSVIVFSVEYAGRLWACTLSDDYPGAIAGRWKAAKEPMAIVDLLAIAPFYLQVLLPGLDLRFVRALRLFRLFRIFKVGRYAESFATVVHVVKNKREELVISFLILLITIVLAGSIMWLFEHEAQPEAFRSVPAAMWWAVITVTTIGYGDVSPITPIGKALGGFVAVLGVCIFALPVGVLGAAFVEEMAKKKGEVPPAHSAFSTPRAVYRAGGVPVGGPPCPHCGQAMPPVAEAHRSEAEPG